MSMYLDRCENKAAIRDRIVEILDTKNGAGNGFRKRQCARFSKSRRKRTGNRALIEPAWRTNNNHSRNMPTNPTNSTLSGTPA